RLPDAGILYRSRRESRGARLSRPSGSSLDVSADARADRDRSPHASGRRYARPMRALAAAVGGGPASTRWRAGGVSPLLLARRRIRGLTPPARRLGSPHWRVFHPELLE